MRRAYCIWFCVPPFKNLLLMVGIISGGICEVMIAQGAPSVFDAWVESGGLWQRGKVISIEGLKVRRVVVREHL